MTIVDEKPKAKKKPRAKFCPICKGKLRVRYRAVQMSHRSRSGDQPGRRYTTSYRQLMCCMTCKVVVQLHRVPAKAFIE